MKFPWQSTPMETRADSSYTDALITAILGQAQGQSTALPAAVGALEAASGLVSRAFASAVVETPSMAVSRALTPSCLALIGRALIRRGEVVFYIDTSHGAIDLLPCQSWDVDGLPKPAARGYYRCTTSRARTKPTPITMCQRREWSIAHSPAKVKHPGGA